MAPINEYPHLDEGISDEVLSEESDEYSLTELTFWYMIVLIVMLGVWVLLFCCMRLIKLGQKTRDAQPRRMYGERAPRRGSPSPPPTVFVTPHNIAPPPKYEMMAPPSYDEVVGVHYPNYPPPSTDSNQVAAPGQPITQPLTVSVAQLATSCQNVSETNQSPTPIASGSAEPVRSTTITVTSS